MELAEAMPLLTENHTAVATTVNKTGKPQSTVVTTGMVNGELCWISRGRTIKVKNIERTGRATVTVINLDTRRYVTIEGTATIYHWPENYLEADIENHVKQFCTWVSRGFVDRRLRAAKAAPGGPQEPPGGLQEAPRRAQERPKSGLREPKRRQAQERPKSDPGEAQMRPRRS